MTEFLRTGPAPFFPHSCVICRESRGMILDSGTEIDTFGRIYFCENCVRDAAVELGFAEGPRMRELQAASSRLVTAERQLQDGQRQIAETLGALDALEAEHRLVTAERERLEGRVAQLEDAIRAKASEELELVGALGIVGALGVDITTPLHAAPSSTEWQGKSWTTGPSVQARDPNTGELIEVDFHPPEDTEEDPEDGSQETSGGEAEAQAEGESPES